MTDILIASHGHMASGLQNSINILTGRGSEIRVIDAYVDNSDYTLKIKKFIKNAKKPAVIFTDLKGGSVNQKVMLAVRKVKDVFVVTQMNLAIILAVLLDSEKLTEKRLVTLINESQVELVNLKQMNKGKNQDFFE